MFFFIDYYRDNKNETLSTDLKKAEKKLDLIKQVCQSTEKKVNFR